MGSRKGIIYTARQFRKKHKPKEFVIRVSSFRKLRTQTKYKILAFVLFFVLILGIFVWYFIFKDLPKPSELIDRKINVSTKIYDRNGILLYQIYKDQNRTLVGFDQIPMFVKLATIACENGNFYREPGFSIKGIVRAIAADISQKELSSGGSTITQQLVKNALLTNEKTLTRKLKELVLSVEVESQFSKDKILEMYLNEVSYGGTAYGIEAASEQYFGKHVWELDLAEAALLAGLPRSPTTYSPFGAYPEFAKTRQAQVLRLMFDEGYINKEQMELAENENLKYSNSQTNIRAAHFVMYVRQRLVDAFGEDEVEAGGLNVTTTLDYNIQQMAQEAVTKNINKLSGLHVTNGASLIINPESGEILAMVGSKDYFDMKIDGNVNVTTALRPPGSSIKIVNYAYALSNGYTPATILQDTPITFKYPGSPSYSPVNYDGKFVGNITLREAFAQSRNIPAVKVLNSYGVDKMIDMGQKMGITTWNKKNTYGLSLTLGGADTKLIDMARVFATIAGYGVRPPTVSILKVTNYKGGDLPLDCDSGSCDKTQVVDPKVAYQIIDILKDNGARSPEFGERSALVIDKHPEVAVKTGTSNDLRDNLTIGFNQKYLTAVWVGNNDNSPMNRIASGITGAAPIWNEIMTKLLSSEAKIEWRAPVGLLFVPICKFTGTLPCSGCPTRNEWFVSGTEPKKSCGNFKIDSEPIP